jgi:transposase, IS30 family
MELRERGWSVDAAAARSASGAAPDAIWAYGYKTYRGGEVVGFVPPLDRLAVREISARFLSQDERIEIADLRPSACSLREIARHLGRSRRRSRGSCAANDLGPGLPALRGAPSCEGSARPSSSPPARHQPGTAPGGRELLAQRWSPQRISRHVRTGFPDGPSMWLSHESVYQVVYEPGSALMRPSRLAPQHRSRL